MTYAIEAEGLVKHFGETKALQGVDLAAQQGTVHAVLGPNGAGKTTAVRILATLTNADGGTARVGGYDIVRDAQKVRQMIGLTGQYASVDEDLTGTENLVLIGRLLDLTGRDAKARAKSCSAGSTSPTRPSGRPRPTPAVCADGSTWPRAWSGGRA
jgi:oleandomycin transport system ATP-binding protein